MKIHVVTHVENRLAVDRDEAVARQQFSAVGSCTATKV